LQTIGILGGTGDLGTALAFHIARVYDKVLVGSRSKERAESAVRKLIAEKEDAETLTNHLIAATNEEVVSSSDIVIATVPYESAIETLRDLAQKFRGNQLLISASAAIKKTEKGEFISPLNAKSLAVQMREFLPSSVKIAVAFQTVPANVLYKDRNSSSFDVLVASEDKETFAQVSALISSMKGLRALDVGSLEQSGAVEGLTSILLNIATRNRLKSPTFKVESF